METTNKSWMKAILSLIIAVSVFTVYYQVISFDFINFDDPVYVKDNPIIKHGISWQGTKWAFSVVYASNWHPLTWISHMVDVELYSMRPGMHHLTNVFLHMLNSILLFIVIERMTGTLWKSAFVAALFALHPLHVESVVWISERKDVLSTLFWLLTMLGYHWYVQRRNINRYLLVTSLFLLGLMAKPMLVTMPFVLLLLDFWPLRSKKFILNPSNIIENVRTQPVIRDHEAIQFLFLEKIPLIIMAFAACGETFYAQSAGGAVSSLDRLGLTMRIQNAIISYADYLLKMVWPLNLSVFYPYPKHFNLIIVYMLHISYCSEYYSSRNSKKVALPDHWLVLVCCNTDTCHWSRAGGITVHGGPVYLHSFDRHIHHGCVGS